MSDEATVVIPAFEMTETEACALSQFVKRVGWHEFRGNAVDDQEAFLIHSSIDRLRIALRRAGFSPR